MTKQESFVTAVHEMTHFLDFSKRGIAEEICAAARKEIGLSKTRIEYMDLTSEMVGALNIKDQRDPAELLAYAVEKESIGKGNKLSKAIYKALLEVVLK